MRIHESFAKARLGLKQAIHEASRLLALLTDSISLAVAPAADQLVLKHLQLAAIEDSGILLTVVLHPGVVKNRLIRTEQTYTPAELYELSLVLNQKLRGVTYQDLGTTILNEIARDYGDIGKVLVELLLQGLVEERNEQVFASGAVNILNQPEFRDVERAIALLEILEEKERLLSLLNSVSTPSGVQVVIGSENEISSLHDCSVISCTYYVGGDVVGTLGVIGPTRMDYAKVVAAVGLVSHSLSEYLTEQK